MSLKVIHDGTLELVDKLDCDHCDVVLALVDALNQKIKDGRLTTEGALNGCSKIGQLSAKYSADKALKDVKEKKVEDAPVAEANAEVEAKGVGAANEPVKTPSKTLISEAVGSRDFLDRELKGDLIIKLSFDEIHRCSWDDFDKGWNFPNAGMQFIRCSRYLLNCLAHHEWYFAHGEREYAPHQTPEVKIEVMDDTFHPLNLKLITTHDIIHEMRMKERASNTEPGYKAHSSLEEYLEILARS